MKDLILKGEKEELAFLLKKARIDLLLHSPFFATVAMSMPLVEDTNLMAAMAVDGIAIYYNPLFLKGASKEKIKCILAHEVMHITNLHHLRKGNRNAMIVTCGNGKCNESECGRQKKGCVNKQYVRQLYPLFGVAADFAINGRLKEAGFDTSFGINNDEYAKYSAEKTYSILNQKLKKEDDGEGGGDVEGVSVPAPSDRGDVQEPKGKDGKKLTEAERTVLESKTKDIIKNAAEVAKRAGKLPEGLERYVKNLFEPKVNWKEKIAQFVCKYSRNDYDWSKRSRRYTDFYMPSLKSPEVGKIVVAIDTSGSLDKKDLEDIASEIMGIVSSYNGVELEVIYCDSKVNGIEHYDAYDEIKLKMLGGGGTDYRPVFNKIAKGEDVNNETPVLLLYFTDGYCDDFPNYTPDYPVMWILTFKNESFRSPFGEAVYIHLNEEEREGY